MSPFMQNMMDLHPDRCALVYYWGRHRIKYTTILLRNRTSGRWGFLSLEQPLKSPTNPDDRSHYSPMPQRALLSQNPGAQCPRWHQRMEPVRVGTSVAGHPPGLGPAILSRSLMSLSDLRLSGSEIDPVSPYSMSDFRPCVLYTPFRDTLATEVML